MLNIAICDDEEIHHVLFKDHLSVFQQKYDEHFSLKQFYSARELLDAEMDYDILFLDIGLDSGEDGVSVGIRLRNQGCKAIFIILSSHNDRYKDAYQANVLRYLEKPVSQATFDDALSTAIRTMHTMRYVIQVAWEGEKSFVPIQNIVYISNYNRKRFLHMADESIIETTTTWADILAQLPAGLFCFAQKSYLIHFHHLVSAGLKAVHMSNGVSINLSRNYKKTFESAYSQYVESMKREVLFLSQ